MRFVARKNHRRKLPRLHLHPSNGQIIPAAPGTTAPGTTIKDPLMEKNDRPLKKVVVVVISDRPAK